MSLKMVVSRDMSRPGVWVQFFKRGGIDHLKTPVAEGYGLTVEDAALNAIQDIENVVYQARVAYREFQGKP